MDEYEFLKKELVSEEDLAAKKAQIRSSLAFSYDFLLFLCSCCLFVFHRRDGSYSIASALNEAIAIGDWRSYTTMDAKIQGNYLSPLVDILSVSFVVTSSKKKEPILRVRP